jgi:hypothetical protein
MVPKILHPSFFINFTLLTMGLFCFHMGEAQSLYVGSGAEFYVPNNIVFTTGNTVVEVDPGGVFAVQSGNTWGSEQEYVNGKVNAYGTGVTKLPTGGNGIYAPVTADHSGNITAIYFNAPPAAGTNGAEVDAVGQVEYWEMTGAAKVTLPWNESSDITSLVSDNGGVLNAVAIVGYDSGSGIWNLISGTQTNVVSGDLLNGSVSSDPLNEVDLSVFGQLTFGIDAQIVLSTDDLFLSAGIELISNPVKSEETDIRFRFSGEGSDLRAMIFDVNGRLLQSYDNIQMNGDIGNLPAQKIKSGLYFLKFEYEGKQGVKTIIIE